MRPDLGTRQSAPRPPVSDAPAPRKVSRATLKAAARYERRLRAGERIMRDAAGRLHWSGGAGSPPSLKTVRHMLETGTVAELDTDLFGLRLWGQTIGQPDHQKEACHG